LPFPPKRGQVSAGALDRVAQIAERKYCRLHPRPFRLGFPTGSGRNFHVEADALLYFAAISDAMTDAQNGAAPPAAAIVRRAACIAR